MALLLSAGPAAAETFQQMWMGRVARPPADNEEASVYWEDKWDARGKRFKPNEVSCAHRTEAFGTIFVVTNLENGKSIECPVQDRGPFTSMREWAAVLHRMSGAGPRPILAWTCARFLVGCCEENRLRRIVPR